MADPKKPAKRVTAVSKRPARRQPRKGVQGIPPPSADELAELRKRQTDAVALAIAGFDYQQIADQLGYADKSGAWRAVRAALDRNEQPKVAEYRELENARLDRLQAAWWQKALTGDMRAATVVLRVFERRARLNGLDQPQQFIGAFAAGEIPRDPAERAAVLIALRDGLAERVAENAAVDGAG